MEKTFPENKDTFLSVLSESYIYTTLSVNLTSVDFGGQSREKVPDK